MTRHRPEDSSTRVAQAASNRTIAVVIPTYNRRVLASAAVRSVLSQRRQPDEFVVVSDGSSDGTDEDVDALGVRRLRTERAGAAAARNAGWRACPSEIVAFIDDDCEAEPDWLERLEQAFDDDAVGLVQGRTLPARQPAPGERTLQVVRENGLYESCNIAYRRAVLEEMDGFDHHFGRFIGGRPFGEDTDLAWRTLRAGWKSRFVPEAVVRHHVFPGGLRADLQEDWRRRHFPYVARRIPELRDNLPRGRWWFRPHSPAAQLAIAGVAGACLSRRPTPLIAALPYAVWLVRHEGRPAAMARRALRDGVTSVALIEGSIRHRSLLL